MHGIWRWLREGTLLTHGRWDRPQKFFYSPTLFTSGVQGRSESRAYTQVSRLPGVALPPPSPANLPTAAPPRPLHPPQHCLPFPLASGPAERWVTNWMNDLSTFCLLPAVPGESNCSPRGLLAAKDVAWEEPAWVEGQDIWFSEQEGSGN